MSLVFHELKSLPAGTCWRKCVLCMSGTYCIFSSHQGTLWLSRFVESTKTRKKVIAFTVTINVACKGLIPVYQEQRCVLLQVRTREFWLKQVWKLQIWFTNLQEFYNLPGHHTGQRWGQRWATAGVRYPHHQDFTTVCVPGLTGLHLDAF